MHCLLLQLTSNSVIREPLDLLAQPVGVNLFHGIHDARVDLAAAFVEHPTVRDVVGEGVLERILQVGKELCRVEEFGCLQIVEQAAKLVLCQPANRMQEREWDVVPNDGRLLQQVLVGGRQRVDTRSETACTVGGTSVLENGLARR